jgi:apolipoprotein N-acyltransferase
MEEYNPVNKSKKVLYRMEQVIIIVAHLALLKWIFYALYRGGELETSTLLVHFAGMALYGAFLIRICAWLAHRRFLIGQSSAKVQVKSESV